MNDADLVEILFFQDKPLNKFPGYAQQKHNDSNGIYGMHYLEIKTRRPVWIFLSEKIHYTNLQKKNPE